MKDMMTEQFAEYVEQGNKSGVKLSKRIKMKRVTMTVKEFLRMHREIDTQPIGQRLNVERGFSSKAEGIVRSILRTGYDLGQITIHKIVGSPMYVYESIDGGHRKRAILAYYQNQYTVDGVYYKDLSDEDKEQFLSYELSFVIYYDLEPHQVGEIFRNLNTTTPVSNQEMVNSYGNIPIANLIRNVCRVVPGVNNDPHEFFEYTDNDGVKKGTWHDLKIVRLDIDEHVARMVYRFYDGGGLGSMTQDDIVEMYKSMISAKVMKKLEKETNYWLDFMLKVAKARKRRLGKMTLKDFQLYSRLWLHWREEYGDFSVIDYQDFYDTIAEVVAPWNVPYDAQTGFQAELSDVLDITKTRGKLWNDSLSTYRSKETMLTTLNWLLREIDIQSILVLKDPVRLFPREWRENKLAEQGFKCAIDGKPLNMKDAHGAHIVSHCSGGKTVYGNMVMVRAEHNLRMGGMNLEDYKALLND